MAITLVGVGASQNVTTGTFSPAWPVETLAVDDFALCVMETGGESAAAHTPAANTGTTGWTTVTTSVTLPRTDVATTAGSKLFIWSTRLTSATPGAAAFGAATDHATGKIYVFRGVHTTTPFDATGVVTTKGTASSTATFPTITTTTSDCLIFFAGTTPNDLATQTMNGTLTNAALTGIQSTSTFTSATTNGHGGSTNCAFGYKAAAGATGTSTRSQNASTTNVTATLALRVAPLALTFDPAGDTVSTTDAVTADDAMDRSAGADTVGTTDVASPVVDAARAPADTVGTADAVAAAKVLTSRLWLQPGADGTSLANTTTLDAATGWQFVVGKAAQADATVTIQGDYIRCTGAPNVARIDGATGSTTDTLMGVQAVFRLPSLPVGGDERILEIDGAAGNHALRILVAPDGLLRVQDQAATRITATGFNVTAGQDFRVFVAAERGATSTTGRVRLDLYITGDVRDPSRTVPDFSGSHTTSNTGVTTEALTHVRLGRATAVAATSAVVDVLYVQQAATWDPATLTPPTPPATAQDYTFDPADTVATADVAAAAADRPRSAADTVGTTDVADVGADRPRTAADTVSTVDSASPVADRPRSAADTVTTADVAGVLADVARGPADTVGTTDAAATVAALTRSPADTVATSDTMSAQIAVFVNPADTVSTSDTASSDSALARTPADTVSTSDVVGAQIATFVGAADTVATSDAASTVQALLRSPADVAGTADVAAVEQALTRSPADTVATSDAVAALVAKQLLLGDVVSTSDAASTVAALLRSPADQVGTNDDLTVVGAGAVSTSDTASTSDAATRTLDAARGPADTVGTSDVVSVTVVRVVTLGDVVGTVDAAARAATMARTAADVVTLADTARTGTPVTVPTPHELRRSSVNRTLTLERGGTLTLTTGTGRRLRPVGGASG